MFHVGSVFQSLISLRLIWQKLHYHYLSATKGFEFGSGFAGTLLTGSIQGGGISNGETIYMRIGFKPTSTIGKKQNTVTRDRQETELIARGRHDPCVVPRAVPMVEAMVALVLVDQLMAHLAQCEMFPVNPAFQDSIHPDVHEPFLVPKLS